LQSKKVNFYNELIKRRAVYLNGHSRKVADKLAYKLIKEFEAKQNFVPGFIDVLVISCSKRLPAIKKFFNRGATVCTAINLPKIRPDLIWVDDVNLLASDIQRLAIKYSGIPHIYSGRKPAKTTLQVIADTREQCPIWQGIQCKRMKLEVGDYTTERLHNKFHVERKSLQDLYGSIVQGHVRFVKELIRAKAYDIKLAIYVEGTRKNFVTLNFPKGKERNMKGETLGKIIDTIERRYKVEVVWCRSRTTMKKQILLRFKKEERKYGKH
jgi:hypothetical protein